MTFTPTALLRLPIITTGTESGTWGDVVDNGLTQYLDIAIAGGLSVPITTADVTLVNTEGTSSATVIGSTTAQYAILNVSGAMTGTRSLILPSSSRKYVINNTTTGGFALTVKGTATSGFTMTNGERVIAVWNGTDYIKVTPAITSAGANADIATLSGLTTATNTPGSAVSVTGGAAIVAGGAGGGVNITGSAGYSSATNANGGNVVILSGSGAGSSGNNGYISLSAPGSAGGTSPYVVVSTASTERIRVTSTGAVALSGASNYGTSGQVLTSAGNLPPTWATPYVGGNVTLFTSSGSGQTFTVPAGVTKVKVTIIGGGAAGGASSGGGSDFGNGGGGGAGGAAIKWLTGLVPAGTLNVTVGAAAGTSSVASGTSNTITTVSATGGSAGANASTGQAIYTAIGGIGGVGSNGDLNITGGAGSNGGYTPTSAYGGGAGGSSIMGGGGTSGNSGGAYGGGGGGNAGAGSVGLVLFEY
jgi:hypothetical protein